MKHKFFCIRCNAKTAHRFIEDVGLREIYACETCGTQKEYSVR